MHQSGWTRSQFKFGAGPPWFLHPLDRRRVDHRKLFMRELRQLSEVLKLASLRDLAHFDSIEGIEVLLGASTMQLHLLPIQVALSRIVFGVCSKEGHLFKFKILL